MSRPAYITLSIVTTFLRCLEYKVPHNCLMVIHEVHGFSTVLFHIFDNAPASYPDLISVLPDGQAVRLHFPAIVIQKKYIQKSLSNHCQPVRIILLQKSKYNIINKANMTKSVTKLYLQFLFGNY